MNNGVSMKALYARGRIGTSKLGERQPVHYVVKDALTGYPHRALCSCDYATVGQGLPSPIHLVESWHRVTCWRCIVMINKAGK